MEIYGLLAVGGGIYDLPVIRQIAWLLGQVMNGLYNLLSLMGIENIGISIIIFTIIVYTILMPLTIKQQKFSKMQAVMQPELQKIQKKYANKRDQTSMMKQQEEMNLLYDKYGVKMSSGCLPSLMQILILFGLYPVVMYVPEYVTKVRNVFLPLVEKIQATSGYQEILESVSKSVVPNIRSFDLTRPSELSTVLYKFQASTWDALAEKIPGLEGTIDKTVSDLAGMNNFLGINIGTHPWELLKEALAAALVIDVILAVIIPVLAGVTQFVSVKLSQMGASGAMLQDSDNPMVSSMKTMTYTMPLISVVFGFTLPAGLGLYWVASAAVRSIQQLAVNKYLKNKSVEDIIEENRKKAQKKREKKGTSAEEINRMATKSTRNAGVSASNKSAVDPEKEEKIKKAQELAKSAKPGSLTSKANLVARYNSGYKMEEDIQENKEDKAENTKETKKK